MPGHATRAARPQLSWLQVQQPFWAHTHCMGESGGSSSGNSSSCLPGGLEPQQRHASLPHPLNLPQLLRSEVHLQAGRAAGRQAAACVLGIN